MILVHIHIVRIESEFDAHERAFFNYYSKHDNTRLRIKRRDRDGCLLLRLFRGNRHGPTLGRRLHSLKRS